MWKTVGSAAVVKVLVMGLTGILGILTNRIIISSFGVAAYGQYGLLSTLPTLLPFADLGMAAVVINAVSESSDPTQDARVRRTVSTAFRVLLASAAVITAVAVSLTALDGWRVILGPGGVLPGAELIPMWCFLILAIGLPLSVGPRILVGLGRTTTQIAASGITGPFMFIGVAAMAAFLPAAGNYLALLSYSAAALVSLLCLWLASRRIKPQVRHALREVPFPKRYPGVRALHLALPMLVQMMALPIAMQTDRLLLSHLTRGNELAQYNLASQLFGIVLQTIAAAGVTLWPVFAKARATNQVVSPVKPTMAFLALGVAGGLVMALLSPYLAAFVTSGAFTLDPLLVWSLVAFVSLQAAKYPAGMYMTDQRGLTFQVWPILVMVPINVGLSWWLTTVVGAAGPVLGSAIGVLLFQVIPNLIYVQRDLARRRPDQQGEDDEDD